MIDLSAANSAIDTRPALADDDRMLGADEQEVLANACLVELPHEWSDYLQVRGPANTCATDARQFRRVFYRQYAVLRVGAVYWSVITCDLSTGGLSLLCHKQLFPGDEVEIYLPGTQKTILRIARCTKRGRRCYVCGAGAATDEDRRVLTQLVRSCVTHHAR
ncbi:MAG: PilZ domain-containing protein [Pirellulales bacterium]|nr:PilZ domain-containing protein [Pirellulales bacterium]